MRVRAVRVGPRAAADIRRIGSYIAYLGAPESSVGYIGRMMEFVLRLDIGAERGRAFNDIKLGLRVIAFEQSATIAVIVSEKRVQVVRVFYRGQDWERSLRSQFRRTS
jgi:plasmid stabilization system protein ParE